MRVWDVSAGYLNRQSLLGEHRELHGLYNILVEGKRGYSRHPETLRWVGALGGLVLRHGHLAAEMRLRGYTDRTPLRRRGRARWPATFITAPAEQFVLLRGKYTGRERGRIPLPRSVQELWGQHKYSVLARDPDAYRHFGRAVSRMRRGAPLDEVAAALVDLLRQPPPRRRLVDAVERMWGHVRGLTDVAGMRRSRLAPGVMLAMTQQLAAEHGDALLLSSTALSELETYVNCNS